MNNTRAEGRSQENCLQWPPNSVITRFVVGGDPVLPFGLLDDTAIIAQLQLSHQERPEPSRDRRTTRSE